MRWTSVLVVLVLALSASACGDDGSTTSTGGAEPWGRTFLSTEGVPVRLMFTHDRLLMATAECNHLGGGAVIEDGVLLLGSMSSTEMGCDPERQAYDEWLRAFLTASPMITLDGATLTLSGADDAMVLLEREGP